MICSMLFSELFSWKLLLIEQYYDVQYGKTKRNIWNSYLGSFFNEPQKQHIKSQRTLDVVIWHLHQLLEDFIFAMNLKPEKREGCSAQEFCAIINKQMFPSRPYLTSIFWGLALFDCISHIVTEMDPNFPENFSYYWRLHFFHFYCSWQIRNEK